MARMIESGVVVLRHAICSGVALASDDEDDSSVVARLLVTLISGGG